MERKGISDEDSRMWQVRQALEQWKEQLGTDRQMGIPLSTNGLICLHQRWHLCGSTCKPICASVSTWRRFVVYNSVVWKNGKLEMLEFQSFVMEWDFQWAD